MIDAYVTGWHPLATRSPRKHAVPGDSAHRGRAGYAVSMCGRSVRHGHEPVAFDPDARNACRSCARVVIEGPA